MNNYIYPLNPNQAVDQFGNEKLVHAKYFQTLPICINEICLSGGSSVSLDPHEAAEQTANALMDIVEANSRARKCGSKSNFQCFMDTDATPDLGKKLCEGD